MRKIINAFRKFPSPRNSAAGNFRYHGWQFLLAVIFAKICGKHGYRIHEKFTKKHEIFLWPFRNKRISYGAFYFSTIPYRSARIKNLLASDAGSDITAEIVAAMNARVLEFQPLPAIKVKKREGSETPKDKPKEVKK